MPDATTLRTLIPPFWQNNFGFMNKNSPRGRGSPKGRARPAWGARRKPASPQSRNLSPTPQNRSHRKAVRLLLYPFLRPSRRVGAPGSRFDSGGRSPHVPLATGAADSAPIQQNRPLTYWNYMNIVVVESPAKAKTINKYLGR